MPNKACLKKAKNQLEKHQMGFDGEHIGETTLKKLKYKNPTLTSHKHKFDILTDREAWEVKTVGLDAEHKMSVKKGQKIKKLAWAKKHKKKVKSMMVIVNDMANVYVKNGLGEFRPGGMKKVATYKNWRKQVGHGRMERLVEGKPEIGVPKGKAPTGINFVNKKDQILYEKSLTKYRGWTEKQFLSNFKKEFSERGFDDVGWALSHWIQEQSTTDVVALKEVFRATEKGTRKFARARIAKSSAALGSRDFKRLLKSDIDRLAGEPYLKLRALNQAFLERKGIKKVTLYRGVDGKHGKKYARGLKKSKADFITIAEDPLTGWTSNLRMADSFGRKEGGITLKMEVAADEIFLHDDFWKMVQKKPEVYIKEHESIILGGSRKVPVKDIFF